MYVYFILRAWNTFYRTNMPYSLKTITIILFIVTIMHFSQMFLFGYVLWDDLEVSETSENGRICVFQSTKISKRWSFIVLLCGAIMDVSIGFGTVYMLVGKLFSLAKHSAKLGKLRVVEIEIEKDIEISHSAHVNVDNKTVQEITKQMTNHLSQKFGHSFMLPVSSSTPTPSEMSVDDTNFTLKHSVELKPKESVSGLNNISSLNLDDVTLKTGIYSNHNSTTNDNNNNNNNNNNR